MRDYPVDYCPCPDYPETCKLAGEHWCCIHNAHEEPKGTDFRWCFECGHVYRSAEELVNEYRLGAAMSGAPAQPKAYHPLIAAETVYFCPLCLHDW